MGIFRRLYPLSISCIVSPYTARNSISLYERRLKNPKYHLQPLKITSCHMISSFSLFNLVKLYGVVHLKWFVERIRNVLKTQKLKVKQIHICMYVYFFFNINSNMCFESFVLFIKIIFCSPIDPKNVKLHLNNDKNIFFVL